MQRSTWALTLLLLCACSRHVRMAVPETAAGARYTCTAKACTPAGTDVPAELNQSGTTFVTLPRECRGRVHQVVVLEADSKNPTLDVTCAPSEEPLKDME